jgi:thiamine biosynthesis lipoprotein
LASGWHSDKEDTELASASSIRIGLLLGLLLAGCSQPADPARHRQFFALGTLIEVTYYGIDGDAAERASQELEQLFRRMHADWHAWQPGRLQDTNRRLSTGEAFPADPVLLPLLEKANHLSRLSDGLFNPTIGMLVSLWGFHSDERPAGPPPDREVIKALVSEQPAVADVMLDGGNLQSSNPAVRYDLGAIVKGYAIDQGIGRLRELGIHNAIINAGGDLHAIGRHGNRPWNIGIRDPRGPGVLASIELRDEESVFTSGDYERYFEYDGRRYHHIIDPRTGYPADSVTSVTVLHTDATTADAAATALFVAGPENWHAIARRMGIRYVLLIDANGTLHMNPAMQERIRFDTEPAEIRLSEPL